MEPEAITVRSLVIDSTLDSLFWAEYADLWQNSKDKSPFQAPQILQFFSSKLINRAMAIRLLNDQNTIGAVLLKRDNNIYSFLSDLKTDANFFVFHKECSDDDIDFFFDSLLSLIKREGWALVLNNMTAWASDMPVFERCGVKSDLFFQSISYSVCPAIKCDNAEEIRNKLYRSERVRVKFNKLKNRLNAEFEVLTGDEDLENWVQEFCNAHILRWGKTSTLSMFLNADRRPFLLACLKAWNADKVLVRFATKINGQRIGFIIGLATRNSLISHSLTYHPDHQKVSPTLALLHTVSEWMIEQKLNVLDFGDGKEDYKYYFANEELELKRVFVSGKTNFSFVAKTKLIKLIKNNSRVYSFYQKKIKRFLIPNSDEKIKAGNTGK